MSPSPSFRDVELLSAYLDGQLSQADSARLEARIKTETELRTVYDDLRRSRALLRKLPARRAPRNFRLTPEMAGIRPPLPRFFPVFRLASALAAILLFFSYAINLSVSTTAASTRAAAPASAFAVGGGAPEEQPSEQMTVEETQTPQTMDAYAPTETEALQDNAAPAGTEAQPAQPGPQAKLSPYAQPEQPQPVSLPVPPAWLLGLLALAVTSAGAGLIIRNKAERDWRKAHALAPQKMTARDILVFGLALLLIILLGAGIYWMSTTIFYAP